MNPDLAAVASARAMAHGEQLARSARKFPNKAALRSDGRSTTFAELDTRARAVATGLAERGIEKGDRVLVLMRNREETVEAFYGLNRLGAIVVPVNYRLSGPEIDYIAADSGAAGLIVEDALAAGVEHLLRSGGPGVRIAVGAEVPGTEQWSDLVSAEPADTDHGVSEHDPAFILYTSGTTGRPKGAVLTHLNLLMNSLTMMSETAMSGSDDVWLCGNPLFHIAGVNWLHPHILAGATSVLTPLGSFDAGHAVDLLEGERVTGCYFVPSQWQDICAVPGVQERDFALRRITWGASMAPPSVLAAISETFPGVPIYNCFGQTEMSGLTCILKGEDAVTHRGSVGKPVMHIEARIVDDDMQEVGVDEVGEIVYRGPTTLREYWNAPEATAEAFAGGWFHSGDLCRIDADGYIWVVDRKKDMIISGGENIYSAEVEAVIDAHPLVREVAVVGAPHPRWVETPVAVIVAVDDANRPTPEDIISWCQARLASYKKPTSVLFVDSLPRNANGKVLKRALRDELISVDAAVLPA
jgi:acyl-CoA synthetase (AMP-forming)/AMP-acid ligase II